MTKARESDLLAEIGRLRDELESVMEVCRTQRQFQSEGLGHLIDADLISSICEAALRRDIRGNGSAS